MNIVPAFLRRRIAHRPNLVKIVDNVGWLFFDKVLRLGVGLFVGVWVARYLGPQQFGILNFGLAFVSLFGAIASLGLNSIVVKDVVRSPDDACETLGTAAALQLIGGIVAYILTLAVIFYIRQDDFIVRFIVAILGTTSLLKFFEISVYWFESQVLSKFTVMVSNVAFLVFAGIKIILIYKNFSLISFVWVAVAEAFVISVALFYFMQRNGPSIKMLRISSARAKSLLLDSWPLIISGIAIALAMRVDQVMIGEMIDDVAVGYYAASVRLAEIFLFLGMIVAQSIFPRLLLLDDEKFSKEFIFFTRYPFYILLLIAVGVSIFSKDIVFLIYGANFLAAEGALSVLIFSIPITFISVMSSQYLLRKGEQREMLLRQVCGLLLNILMNTMLIPYFGIVGAAMATVATDLLIAFGMDVGRKKYSNLLMLKNSAIFNCKSLKP